MIRLIALCCLIFAGLLAWVVSPVYSQKTQNQVVKSSGAEQDQKANSEAVPQTITHSSQFERVVIARFKYQTDLLEGLEQTVEQEQIRNAVILSGLGSVRGYHVHGVSNREFPSMNFYAKDPTHPADIINISGMVMDGRVHAHITLADDQRAFGGHLEPGTEVFTFAIVTLGVLPDGLDLSRLDDKTHR